MVFINHHPHPSAYFFNPLHVFVDLSEKRPSIVQVKESVRSSSRVLLLMMSPVNLIVQRLCFQALTIQPFTFFESTWLFWSFPNGKIFLPWASMVVVSESSVNNNKTASEQSVTCFHAFNVVTSECQEDPKWDSKYTLWVQISENTTPPRCLCLHASRACYVFANWERKLCLTPWIKLKHTHTTPIVFRLFV